MVDHRVRLWPLVPTVLGHKRDRIQPSSAARSQPVWCAHSGVRARMGPSVR